MNKSRSGFTIVELLIVIVVIGILAAITVVAYNGIQDRSNNTKTTTAAAAWVKALRMYEVDKDELPHVGWDSCLGSDYPWDYAGTADGTNQCRYTTTNKYYIEKAGFNTALAPYVGAAQLPTPSMQAIGSTSSWVRGVTYIAPSVGGTIVLSMVLKGVAACPVISGITPSTPNTSYAGGVLCSYPLGTRLR